ncbi:branched-chain amino acid ABC transporter permease [Oribacterium sp. WCC10]|uniref:branched-chain amino acid ABC transporter permease n=1 Tax=Oribacterium sp. WCC10 TaxID=1855343 RepID=UPI0008E9AD52|nr:branched-chain amino acid ABC transporter permease [Oribacterium sp. WCC10]SFG62475.1 branched-chain amino acid transport system permease protein [Oribacterium sp. WCC10]
MMEINMIKKYLLKYGTAMLLFLLPLIVSKSIMTVVCSIAGYFIIAGALNSINGYSGQMCFGIAGFYCVGAYTMAILMNTFHISFWIALLPSGIMAAFAGMLVALPTLKLRGMFMAMLTIGFSEVMRMICLNWTSVTGGTMGIKGIKAPLFFGIKTSGASRYYYIYLVTALLFIFCTNRVIHSRIGRAWMAIREDDMAARSLGVSINLYKILNFMYGAFWAGIAGALLAPYKTYIDSSYFTLDEGFNILSMVIIGGQGTLAGPMVGVVIYQLLVEGLRFTGVWRYIGCAVLIIAMMWLRPQGMVGDSDSVLAGNKTVRTGSNLLSNLHWKTPGPIRKLIISVLY